METVHKIRTWSWSANSIELGQTARMCRPAWFYTGGKATYFHSMILMVKVNYNEEICFKNRPIKIVNSKYHYGSDNFILYIIFFTQLEDIYSQFLNKKHFPDRLYVSFLSSVCMNFRDKCIIYSRHSKLVPYTKC